MLKHLLTTLILTTIQLLEKEKKIQRFSVRTSGASDISNPSLARQDPGYSPQRVRDPDSTA